MKGVNGIDGNIFEKAHEESNMQQVKEAAAQMYQIYREFCEAGFTKAEAMTLLIAMLNYGGKRPEKKDDNADA